MSKYTYFTEEGLNKLKDELHYLKTKGRADIANQIAEARDKGDLSTRSSDFIILKPNSLAISKRVLLPEHIGPVTI